MTTILIVINVLVFIVDIVLKDQAGRNGPQFGFISSTLRSAVTLWLNHGLGIAFLPTALSTTITASFTSCLTCSASLSSAAQWKNGWGEPSFYASISWP